MAVGQARKPGPGYEYSEIDAAICGLEDDSSDHEVFLELASVDSDDEGMGPPHSPSDVEHQSHDVNSTDEHEGLAARQGDGSTACSSTALGAVGWISSCIPSWDWPFNQAQLHSWRSAETIANCSIKDMGQRSSKKKNWKIPRMTQLSDPEGHFTAALTCRGSFPGYSSKTGAEGTGY